MADQTTTIISELAALINASTTFATANCFISKVSEAAADFEYDKRFICIFLSGNVHQWMNNNSDNFKTHKINIRIKWVQNGAELIDEDRNIYTNAMINLLWAGAVGTAFHDIHGDGFVNYEPEVDEETKTQDPKGTQRIEMNILVYSVE